MTIWRTITRGAPLWLLALALAAVGCEARGQRDDGRASAKPAPIAAPPPDPGTAPKNEVERYSGMELEGGRASVRQTITARKSADASSTVVATLYAGTVVTRVARFGEFDLVAWTSLAGPQQGWVDGGRAFPRQRDGTRRRPGSASSPVGSP